MKKCSVRIRRLGKKEELNLKIFLRRDRREVVMVESVGFACFDEVGEGFFSDLGC